MNWSQTDGLNALKQMQIRTSCRSFQDKPVPAEIMEEIFKAALQAPSGGNLQPVTVINITDKEKNEKLMQICGNQKFIGEAPVNLVFFIDWNKMSVFAENEKAPFTCDDSLLHFLIALEDLMCTAQIIETAAHLCGLGSCYVGTVISEGDKICEMLNMPKQSFPMVSLSLGYPKAELKPREKLGKEMMIFENSYPENIDNEYIVNEFRKKYGDRATPLPKDETLLSNMVEALKQSFSTSYGEEEVEAIIKTALENGKINETQRRFGLHYHAKHLRSHGWDVVKKIENNGLTPFGEK